jgi:hypothetical protein
MPVRLTSVAQGQGLAYSAYGRATGPDFVQANERVMKMSLGELVFAVVDHSGASEVDYDGTAVKRIVEQDKELMKILRPGFLVAVVAPRNLEYGFSRMWQQMAEITGWEIMVVRTREEADRWVRAATTRKFNLEIPPFAAELDAAASEQKR